MATELFSLWGYTGWLAQHATSYSVTADFDGNQFYVECSDYRDAQAAFYRAARRARVRRLWTLLVKPMMSAANGRPSKW